MLFNNYSLSYDLNRCNLNKSLYYRSTKTNTEHQIHHLVLPLNNDQEQFIWFISINLSYDK